ncbi:MAG: hypothetical protein V1493_01745 [Candidatus Diapherotrites archaeon]
MPGKNLHPHRSTMARLRWQAKRLKAQGLDRYTRRQLIVESEMHHWVEGSRRGFGRQTPKNEASLQRQRSSNKAKKLIGQLNRAKTSKKRMRAIALLGEMRSFDPKAVIRLRQVVRNPKATENERIEALHAINYISGRYAGRLISAIALDLKMSGPVMTELENILATKINPSDIQLFKQMAARSSVPKKRVLGLRVLSKMPTRFAITSLARLINEISPGTASQLKFSRKSLQNLQMLMREEGFLEESTEASRRLVQRMAEQLSSSERQGYSLFKNIFLVGETARAARKWIERFGRRYRVDEESCNELIYRLDSNKSALLTLMGERQARYAITQIDRAIGTIEKHRDQQGAAG